LRRGVMAMRIDIFDDWLSWIHFVLGLACPVIKIFSIHIYIGIVLMFLVYELVESLDLEEFLGDVAEFGFGYIFADIFMVLQRAAGTSPSPAVFVAEAAVAALLVAAQKLLK